MCLFTLDLRKCDGGLVFYVNNCDCADIWFQPRKLYFSLGNKISVIDIDNSLPSICYPKSLPRYDSLDGCTMSVRGSFHILHPPGRLRRQITTLCPTSSSRRYLPLHGPFNSRAARNERTTSSHAS